MAASRKKKTVAAPLGRYLRRFTLQNVRTFRSPVTLDFCHPNGKVAQWTVILGENGTGKTTLLQYLAGMAPIQDKEVANIPVKKGMKGPEFVFRPIIAGEDWLGWHVRNVSLPWARPTECKVEIEVSSAARSLREAKPAGFKKPFGLRLRFDEAEGRPKIQITFTGSTQIDYYEQFRLFGYGAGRHVAGAASPYLTSDSFFQNGGQSALATLFNDDIPLISPEQWLLSLDHGRLTGGESGKKAKRAFNSTRRCLVGALPQLTDISVRPFGYVAGQNPMTLMCQTPFSPKPLPFIALSVGYRTMTAWLTDFIKRMHDAFPKLREPDNGPAVVLIDEFDLHMHPKWQREAMAALGKEFPNTQFIVTAHSPLIVQATEGDARIIVLRRKHREDGTEEVEVINDPYYAAGWRVDQILASDLYDLPPRSPKFDALMKERIALRQKDKRTKSEEKHLAEIEKQLNEEAPPESAPGTDKLFVKLERALDRAEANQRK